MISTVEIVEYDHRDRFPVQYLKATHGFIFQEEHLDTWRSEGVAQLSCQA
jgi:hypothetical protein